MDKLTPTLNDSQIKENISALQKQGVDNSKIQAYVDNYSKGSDGNYVLKNPAIKPIASNEDPNALTSSPVGSLPVIKQATQLGVGIGSAIGNAGLGLGKAALKVSRPVANLMGLGQANQEGQDNIDAINKGVFQDPYKKELNTVGGKVGQGIGTIATAIEAGKPNASLANKASEAIPLFKGAKIAKVAAGAAAEGLANFGEGYALSGGDTKAAATQGITAGALKGLTGTIGEVANSTKFPQKLMGNIYKTDKQTVANIFNEADNANAVVSSSKEPTQKLSEWALNKGLSGSLESQAKQVQGILKDSENKVISSAEASKTRIPVEPNLFKMAQGIQSNFQDVGRGEIAQKADKFLQAVKDNTVSVKDAIEFRRLIDNTLRTRSSFNNPTLADNLAYWANDLRKSINATDGIGAVNKDYGQAIKARDALIKAATAADNKKALGALEAYTIGGGIATHLSLPALGTVVGKRVIQSPAVTSKTAQALKNLATSSTSGANTRSAIGNLLGKIVSQ